MLWVCGGAGSKFGTTGGAKRPGTRFGLEGEDPPLFFVSAESKGPNVLVSLLE
jgi:hypothetical protein